MAESLEAVRIEGVISIVGFLGGQTAEKEPSYLQALVHSCVIRGVQIGSRPMHEAMVRILFLGRGEIAVFSLVLNIDMTVYASQMLIVVG
jgi:hypothetical protein